MNVQYLEVSLNDPAADAGVVTDALVAVVQKSLRALMKALEAQQGFQGARLLKATQQHVHLLEVTWAAEAPQAVAGWPLQLNGVKCRAWEFAVLERTGLG